jgi:hypothetical protein
MWNSRTENTHREDLESILNNIKRLIDEHPIIIPTAVLRGLENRLLKKIQDFDNVPDEEDEN